MKLTRRAFFEGLACAMATVAIATRMAPKFLPDSLRGGTWRYEQATDKYFYGLDIAKPWDVHLFEQTEFHDPESWKLMDPTDLMQRAYESIVKTEREVTVRPLEYKACSYAETPAWMNEHAVTHETVAEWDVDPDREEAMEACSIIAMSQGFAALQLAGPGPIWPDKSNTQELDVDIFSVPQISTTEEELFRHG